MATDYLKRETISHTRKVCSIYKRMCRDQEFWIDDRFECIFKKLQIRAEFDRNKNIRDIREAKALLDSTEHKFLTYQIHPYHKFGQPLHPYSKEGIAYGRNLESPDYVMDWYHPLEKAQYPYYFSKREQMKDEYVKLWTKKMYKPGQLEKKNRS